MLQTHMTIEVFSHHFKVSRLTPRGRDMCLNFSKRFFAWGFRQERGRGVRFIAKVYAAANIRRTFFRFHINCLEEFKSAMADACIIGDLAVWVEPPKHRAVDVAFKVKPHWKARPDQQPYIDYLSAPFPVCKLVGLQTGGGKTFCALQAVANIGKRVGIFVKANYVKKWVEDVKKTFDIPDERILVIQGGKSLMALLALAKEGKLEADVIIFSLTTLGIWLDAYETEGEGLLDQGYDCLPEDWLNFLGIGVKLVDEAHQHFHAVFKLDLYSHVEYSIALSATMVNKDPFLLKMYDLKFPGKDRPMNMALKRYAHAYAVHYNFIAPDKIHTTERGSNTYSHTAVEKSIMRHIPTLKNYVDMIDYVIRIGHFENPKKVKKLAVFAASIEMCTHLTEYFSRKYPDLDIRRYVGGDPYANAIEADIRFTTVGSMGTAIDIPDLTTVILTNAIASLQANVQVLGRLREIVGEKVEFYYFTADNIPKHVEYYEEKKVLMKERAASFHEVFVGFKI